MSAPAQTEVETVKIKVNGREIDAPKDRTILQTCLDNGIYVPHYCYHPGLSIAGNCRMCLVMASNSRKPIISCASYPAPDIEVTTEGPEVKKLRESIMEFLLINHPLDCPVCDQAGECDLQEYSFRYGKDDSRFIEEKNYRHTKKLGPNVRLYGNRCIVCTRCVRFAEEVAGTGELCVRERGDRSIIDIFPGIELDNPISACTVDICPVGALLADDFVHKTRVFFLETTKSVCNQCATGCSINVDAWNGEIQRLRPRENADVNDWWMCDAGRNSYKYVAAPERLTRYEVGPADRAGGGARSDARSEASLADAVRAVVDRAALVRKDSGAGAFAFIGSAWMTAEEMWLFGKLAEALAGAAPGELASPEGSEPSSSRPLVGLLARPDGDTWRPKTEGAFRIEADKNPNRRGAEAVLPAFAKNADAETLAKKLREGIRFAWVCSGIPGWEPPASLIEALSKVERVVVQDLLAGPLAETATILLPGAAFAEKDGVLVNGRGWAQRHAPALEPPGAVRPELELYQEVLRAAGARDRVLSAEGVLRELADEGGVAAFAGMSWRSMGALGQTTNGKSS